MIWRHALSYRLTLLLFVVLVLACRRPEVAGRLAYIGGDGNVYVTAAADVVAGTGVKTAVTTDAESAHEGAGLSYHRLAWSPAGQLAFASVVRQHEAAPSRLYVLAEAGAEPLLVAESAEHFVIYTYWNPASCVERCQQFAYLIEEAGDISLRLVDLAVGSVGNVRLGQGWPFYFSWAANGRSLLGHVGQARQDEPTQRLIAYDLAAQTAVELPQQTGQFLAPAWSPVGQAWAAVFVQGEEAQLTIVDGEETTVVATASVDSDIAFNWSPTGQQLAYMVRARRDEPFYGGISLYDRNSDEATSVLDVGMRPTALFWSPDGRQLGYLNWIPLGGDDWAQWRVLHLETGVDRGYELFHPTPALRFAVSSFTQYGQSHRLWSPNGRFLVYAKRNFQEQDTIWLIDTWAESDADPIFVDDGSLAFWSWQ